MKVFIDIETSDPDDILSLIYLLGIEKIKIIGISIYPGSHDQIDLVKHILKMFNDEEIPIGSYMHNEKYKSCKLSKWYHSVFGNIPKTDSIFIDTSELISKVCDENTIMFTAGPTKNFSRAVKNNNIKIAGWYVQGGFAGVNVVPSEYILDQFKDMITCSTSNFGSYDVTNIILNCKGIPIKYLCSKNVCHGIKYDKELHNKFYDYLINNQDKLSKKYISNKLIYHAMDIGYTKK